MTSRERVKAALTFQPVDVIPLETEWGITDFESDVLFPTFTYGRGKSGGVQSKKGHWFDHWGCKWECGEDGVKGEVKEAMIAELTDDFYIPHEVLEQADMSKLADEYQASNKFTMKMWGIEPFQRMQYLRGTEELFMDIAMEDDDLLRFIEKVHGFFKAEVQLWAESPCDGIHLEDDWGTQTNMLISPNTWRQLFKPLYKEYCDIAHKHNKLVVMHSDGNILDIIPDLIEIGVNAINPQLNVMPYEQLASLMKGKAALWGGIDRQWLLPFGTTTDVEKDIQNLTAHFVDDNKAGVVGQCFRDKGAKEENILEVYRSWRKV